MTARTVIATALIALSGCGDTRIEVPATTCDGGVWEDTVSGHTWQNPAASEPYAWSEASQYCEGLTCGGYTDWQLPSIDELRSLIRGCANHETGGSCGVTDSCLSFPSCQDNCEPCHAVSGPGPEGCYWDSDLLGSCWFYWSSSAVEGRTGPAWLVIFDLGYVNYDFKGFDFGVRCVR